MQFHGKIVRDMDQSDHSGKWVLSLNVSFNKVLKSCQDCLESNHCTAKQPHNSQVK